MHSWVWAGFSHAASQMCKCSQNKAALLLWLTMTLLFSTDLVTDTCYQGRFEGKAKLFVTVMDAGAWPVLADIVLSVWLEQKVNLSQSEYSSFHEHLNRSLWGNGPANQSLQHKNKLASSYIDPIVQACRLVFVPSPHWRTDWSRRYICTHLNYTSFGFTACAFWVCPDVEHAPLSLHVLSVCVWAEGSEQSGLEPPSAERAAKWHPGGNQKHALASLSLPLEVMSDYPPSLALPQFQTNTQASMKARRGIKEGVCVLGESLNQWIPECWAQHFKLEHRLNRILFIDTESGFFYWQWGNSHFPT